MNDVFGKQLGQYILLEQIGEGGMAKVYNALDTRRESNVAIKVILPSKRNSQVFQVFLEQFKMEAQALAKLTHTNIVKVLNYGIENDQPYLVMEYIPGGTLKDAMNQKLPWQTAAAILAPIARALEYVHRQQIVHRDVKPSNILLQEDFRPMLSDFGILKLLETKEEKVSSAIGVGVGTPEYMSPEQGMGKDVDFRADIYSLGLVFYELVTGQKPFTADTPMAMVLRHVTDELPLPTSIDRRIPKFVEKAMVRALQKKPEDRYASMGDFADALEMIALGKNAPEQKILKIAALKKRRNPYIPVVLLTVFLAAIIGASIWGYSRFYAQIPQQTPEPSLAPIIDSGNVEVDITQTPLPTAPGSSEPLPTSAPPEEPTPVPAAAQSAGVTLLGTPFPDSLPAKAQEIARWGIGGVSVVDWSEKAIALGTTSGIFLYDAQSREMILFIDTKFNVTAMSFSPDGSGITAGSADGNVTTWNTETGAILQDFNKSSGIVNVIAYSKTGNNFAVGYSNGTINYFSTSLASPVTKLDEYPTVEDLAISDDGRFIYASNGKNTVSVWDIQKKTKESELVHTAAISNLSLSSDRRFMLSGGSTNAVYLWDLTGPRLVSGFTALGGTAIDFDFSYDDKYAVIGLNTGEIKVFEIPAPENYSKTQVPLHTQKGYAEQIRSVVLSPNQLIAATGNWEEGLKLWDVLSGENVFSLDQSMRAIEEIYFSEDGRWLATSHDGNTVRVWRVSSAEKVYQFEGYLPKGVPFSPDHKYLVFIKPSGRNQPDAIQVVELASGSIVANLPGFPKDAFVRFKYDSKLLIAGTPYEAVIWDVSTWEKLASSGGPTAGCGQYFTPQNKLLSVISDGGIFFSYDRRIQDMCGLADTIAGATFMYYFPDRNELLFVLGDGTIWIGNNTDSSRSRILPSAPYPLPGSVFIAGHESGYYAQAVDDNLAIKSFGVSSSVNVRHNDDYLYRAAFNPGKKLFALGSKYGSIHIWVLP